ncbi:3'-5' exonuclease [Cyanobacteria bacterium FACHB-472]|nr:3'-5' exonuclease [Cyanobacteria bacterium FACHB-472]
MISQRNSDKERAIEWARSLLQRKDWCVLDTETTGLESNSEICQIALTDSSGSPLMNTLVKPTVPISLAANHIHGITNDKVKEAPNFESLLIPLLKAVGSRDLVIYNAEFDLKLIRQSLRPYGIQLAFPTSDRRQCRIFTNGGSIICAMQQYSQFIGEWKDNYGNYKWQKLPYGNHSALGDCQAVIKVINEMAQSHTWLEEIGNK